MKTITKKINLYTFTELSEEAKENVRQWYLDDDCRAEIFTEDITENFLKEEFPESNLNVEYSLGYCQGDGLNIYGRLNLYDFLPKWETAEKEKRTIKKYIDNSIYYYDFYKNRDYGYSCKFLDKKYIEDTIKEFIENLKYQCFKNIKIDVIREFFNDVINYFETLDKQYEKAGYKWFYEADDEEIEGCCLVNEWFFTESGEFYPV